MELEEEKQLVEKSKKDPIAFGELYNFYYPKIFNYILHRVREVEDTADITSDVFFKVMKNLVKFEWRDIPFSSWIYKIASNEIINHFRKKRFRFLSLKTLFEDHDFDIADKVDLHEDYIQAQKKLESYEDFKYLQNLLKKLPTKYQEVIVLRFFENKKIREISEITGKNVNTVKSLLSRGLEILRRKFIDEKGVENSFLETQPFSMLCVIDVEEKTHEN